jgi:hypothetical protein
MNSATGEKIVLIKPVSRGCDLVLEPADRSAHGEYSCRGVNVAGEGHTSAPLHLTVFCKFLYFYTIYLIERLCATNIYCGGRAFEQF